ncbi:MAG: sigma-70 family RNA polymerase sigma factor [Bacteroidales bacterium]|jgi:RNA polymerase sigma factor (sigma-70 family)|nr:sigma-70 family RNA polymerase sigma factor [Bacteroidales bacterium]
MIRLLVYKLGGTGEDAKDIFQDGLMIMLEKIDNKNFVLTCKFKTFLYCVCENLWKAVLEKRKASANYLIRRIEIDSDNDFTDLLDNKLYKTIFWGVFESLDKVSKEILKLYWQEISPQEIANTLGYTYGYVRKKKCEAQTELTAKVKRHPDYRRIMNSDKVVKNVVY